jgi:hypothetical protein
LLVKLTRLFGDFKTVYDGHIDDETLHKIPLEFHKDRINYGGEPCYDYLTLKNYEQNEEQENTEQDYNAKMPVFLII